MPDIPEQEFTSEEQNAAAWLSLVLLMAENRAILDAFRKILINKGIVTEEEALLAIKAELDQPALGNWYGFMNQLYAMRVTETLDIARRKKAGEFPEDEAPKGELTDVSGDAPIPTGPPSPTATTTIIQTEPKVEVTLDEKE